MRSLTRTTRARGAHTAPFEELTDAVAVHEVAVHEGNRSLDRLERVATALHHVHLPKLADANIVAYDHEAGWSDCRLPHSSTRPSSWSTTRTS